MSAFARICADLPVARSDQRPYAAMVRKAQLINSNRGSM